MCVCIFYLYTHMSVHDGLERCRGGSALFLCAPARLTEAGSTGLGYGPGWGSKRVNHPGDVTSLELLWLKLRGHRHSSQCFLQCCPNRSSWSLTSAGFSCILSCSNKSEEAAPALESLQCRQMGSISPRPCCRR